ncbi:small acid-soluble spore protein Tlp [Salipaludibacillus neizhouensis]|uniref:Small, acid-soluble spore protein Tlp n=1 Tax=Salipaludibacillus neizhouensis TaxID=885475 RepID=A0A3A9KHY4_9BACI|nr:small acid-soluble spore protein Tlp [Salipaludibacillus neizhouensis]RKL69173.1 small acid-soluble spore protein Tlp [Salipaludibacillus neizhouensis]
MPKKDNRENNVERLEQMVENTEENYRAAEVTANNDDMPNEEKQAIREKNHRREESIEGFRAEIGDEKEARNRGEV